MPLDEMRFPQASVMFVATVPVPTSVPSCPGEKPMPDPAAQMTKFVGVITPLEMIVPGVQDTFVATGIFALLATVNEYPPW